MNKFILPDYLQEYYVKQRDNILAKLNEFKSIPQSQYFYELVYCLCTPMSKAKNAILVQNKLESLDFINNPSINLVEILSSKDHYIRFHNQKVKFISEAQKNFNEILHFIKEDIHIKEKREYLVRSVKGIGYKEASHFLRNIGFFGLAILDRHILKNMVKFNQIKPNFSISGKNNYEKIEKVFVDMSKSVNLQIEELDILLWASETNNILK
ncbi:MAG: hypothetical protein A2X64_06620 [Ignavibacteria bacterium GWF2_33_9]|nr:MAG: hypothetical protein A2X64_06620 [Ignavibacteria bacterium GWF2_33_9]